MAEIRKNRWFANGTKIGFALGEDADVKLISSVVGNSEAVLKTTDLELFKRLMKFVSVTASMLVSQSATTETASTGKEIIERAKEELGVPSDAVVCLNDDEYDKEQTAYAGNEDWKEDKW